MLQSVLCFALLVWSTPSAPGRSLPTANNPTATHSQDRSDGVYLNPATGRFWTSDEHEGNQESPPSLHKYLYCQSDPVDASDPTGLKSAFNRSDAAAIGREVHERIGQDFVSSAPRRERATAKSVFTLLGLPNPQSGKTDPTSGLGRLFPDLVDIKHKEIYEIKPLSVGGVAGGIVQIGTYLEALNLLDPSGGWGVAIGPEHYSSFSVYFIASPLAAIEVLPPVLGVIFYKAERIEDFGKARAKNVSQAEEGRVEQATGTSTLTSLLLGF